MRRRVKDLPRVFHVNWFRKDENGKFMWPGFGENMRVLKWIVERVEGKAAAHKTALGFIPDYTNLDWNGLAYPQDKFVSLTAVNQPQWQQELKLHDELLTKLSYHLPAEMKGRYSALQSSL
jgi:phosphoenolpyruvate carboxykinase (GTP)